MKSLYLKVEGKGGINNPWSHIYVTKNFSSSNQNRTEHMLRKLGLYAWSVLILEKITSPFHIILKIGLSEDLDD